MSPRAAGGTEQWVIVKEPAPEAPSAVFELECTTCGHASGPTEDAEVPREWAVRHVTGWPGHTGFREITHRFWRARPEHLPSASA